MNVYVVSPSATGPGTANQWLPLIEQHHVALMGWSTKDQVGRRFASIAEGDLIIIARGANNAKQCFFAGIADRADDSHLADKLGIAQVRHLQAFTSLQGKAIPFNDQCAYGASNQIVACYKLYPEQTPADKAVVDKVLTVLEKTRGNTMVNDYCQLLEQAKQLVLTGAPGTGKTYLARQIAMKMILGKTVADEMELSETEKKKLKAQREFVQFHPSFDYTDFVEGLRPVKSEDGNTLGFERRDGVFKAFCRRALESAEVGRVDNFDEAWKALLSELETKERLSIPLISGTGHFPLALNEYGTGLASRTYDETGKDWIRGQSKFFTKEQVYNVYLGKPGIPSGGHDNYRKAIVAYMRKNCQLAEYRPGKTPDEKKLPPYVMIIDEINRGDISKIFGELFFAIDKGYRGQSDSRVTTQYDNLIDPADPFFGGFFVPKNVYIIGTMNDIDRNVESMDFAIRRRFTWKEIGPAERFDAMWSDIADASPETKEQARQCMIRINAVISGTNGLGPAFQIGPSYFRELSSYREDPDGGFRSLWSNHIEPLVREYLRGFPNAEEIVNKIAAAFFSDQGAQGSDEPQAH